MRAMKNLDESCLIRWTEYHGFLMIAGWLAVLAGAPVMTVAWLALLSFAVLTVAFRAKWTPAGGYGAANFVTAFRFGLTCMLLSFSTPAPMLQFSLAVTALVLDGVDGWLARRLALNSAYGEFLDKEVDAFFTLALCLTLYLSERFGLWILMPGTLRYVFVLFIRYAGPPATQENPMRWSRALGAFALGALIVCLLPLGPWSVWIGVMATIIVLASFSRSFWDLYRG